MNVEIAQNFRALFRRLTTGVTLIGVDGESGPAGMTVNSLTPVSLDPPMLLFCAAANSGTAKLISQAGHFSANILSDLQQEASMHYAGRPLNIPTWSWKRDEKTPWLEKSNATFLCRLTDEYSGGDHRILVGTIYDMFGPQVAATPLLYHGGKYSRLSYEEPAAGNTAPIEDFWWTG